ncbi:hypothetical protein L228DRAFT_279596 [Xylona heveae TC161]|uniref:HMG box domain-containing protein n=1 Tax=Xylona heveae (strain CBS 132557 / TC161) TaxID=1328760 RepID=A0A165JLG8_XYLHT|nr:hypothetical protein L228DRAFT_279596 [Xylona heveae TC161]KZF26387.1 hypothetical protein L228DRAFT_279596 [Xylona heveae TC161]
MIGPTARVCVRGLRINVTKTTRIAQLLQNPKRVQGVSTTFSGPQTAKWSPLSIRLQSQAIRSFATATAKPKASKKKTTTSKKTKKTKAKPKAKSGRSKKVLTEEQKLEAQKKKERAQIRQLKATALEGPKPLPETAFMVLNIEMSEGGKGLRASEAGERYRSFSPEERERYDRIAEKNKANNEAALKKWIESHTPEEIQTANRARRVLSRRLKNKKIPILKDDRQVKPPPNHYTLFFKEKYNSTELQSSSFTERGLAIAKAWKELPQSEKQKYIQQAEAEKEKYQKEFKDVYGREAGSKAPALT